MTPRRMTRKAVRKALDVALQPICRAVLWMAWEKATDNQQALLGLGIGIERAFLRDLEDDVYDSAVLNREEGYRTRAIRMAAATRFIQGLPS